MSVMRETGGTEKLAKLPLKKPKRHIRTGTPRDGSWRPKFIAALKQHGNITVACAEVRISRTAFHEHIAKSAVFRRQRDNAILAAAEREEFRMDGYAGKGVPETVFLPGETIEEERVRYAKGPDGRLRAVTQKVKRQTYIEKTVFKPSVTAGIFRLKALLPDKYRDNVKLDANLSGSMQVIQSSFDPKIATGPDPEGA